MFKVPFLGIASIRSPIRFAATCEHPINFYFGLSGRREVERGTKGDIVIRICCAISGDGNVAEPPPRTESRAAPKASVSEQSNS